LYFRFRILILYICINEMGLFGNIFKKKQEYPAADLSVLKTDIHSHFIPGIDDGASNMEHSLELIRGMQKLGYKKLITTPHIMGDFYRNTPEIIRSGLKDLRDACKKENIEIELDAASEYYIDYEFLTKIKEKELLTFGKNYVLVEISFLSEPPMLGEAVFNMLTSGYQPVLAHVERYVHWHQNFGRYEELKSRGVLLQLNINSLTGYYSPEVKKMAEQLIEAGMISFLGSDCHHTNHIDLMNACLKEPYLHQLLASGNLLNNTL